MARTSSKLLHFALFTVAYQASICLLTSGYWATSARSRLIAIKCIFVYEMTNSPDSVETTFILSKWEDFGNPNFTSQIYAMNTVTRRCRRQGRSPTHSYSTNRRCRDNELIFMATAFWKRCRRQERSSTHPSYSIQKRRSHFSYSIQKRRSHPSYSIQKSDRTLVIPFKKADRTPVIPFKKGDRLAAWHIFVDP